MTRQSITLSQPNDEWLKAQVNDKGEYANKSELINDLIRQARRNEAINKKLEAAEQSGFSPYETKEERLAYIKSRLNIE